MDAVRRPRHEVFVPKSIGPMLHLYAWLAPRGRLFVGRALGIDKVATGVDAESRAAYERRMAGTDA